MQKWLKELRIAHYLKNCLLFVPVFFGGKIFESACWGNLAGGFISFCMGASVVYLINDVKDIEKDKKNPWKKNRPVAAGEITIAGAVAMAIVLLVCSYIGLFLFLEDTVVWKAVIVFSCYLLVNVFYSILGLKRIPLLDVALLVSGFYLRILMGSVLTGIKISEWLYLVIICGAFYLGFGKRRNELKVLGGAGRDALLGYTEEFLDKVTYVCMTLVIVFFALWCVQAESEQNYILQIPILMLICFRYSMDIEQAECDGDPMNVLLQDKALIGLILLLFLSMLWLLYI